MTVTWGSGVKDAESAVRVEPTFEMVKRGFDPDQVQAHLKKLNERVAELEAQLQKAESARADAERARDEVGAAAPTDPFETVSARVAELMRTFDREVERSKADAQSEAERIIAEAKSEAERAKTEVQAAQSEAQTRAETILADARREADQIGSDLRALHDTTLEEIRIMRDHMVNSVKELDVVLEKTHAEERPEEPERVIVLGEAGNGSSPKQEPTGVGA